MRLVTPNENALAKAQSTQRLFYCVLAGLFHVLMTHG